MPLPMILLTFFLLAENISAQTPTPQKPAELCAALNYCLVTKSKWKNKGGWVKEYVKDKTYQTVCGSNAEDLTIKDGGVSITVFQGDPQSSDPNKVKPWISVDLYSYKRTFVVASARSPIDSTYINFSHRITPRGTEVIEVTCQKV